MKATDLGSAAIGHELQPCPLLKDPAGPAQLQADALQARARQCRAEPPHGADQTPARFNAGRNIGNARVMVPFDEIERNAAQAHLKRLEGLVEDVRKALAGSRNASEKAAWLKEMLAAQGYRVDATRAAGVNIGPSIILISSFSHPRRQ
ncbi:hypothetical protein [Bradyrhizobium japonicum]|uniref:hypothetical protein n=1 Tax=Bradyrhizobium japonicum TaxID=375 RepID=UPI0011DD33ED|nr:hypothetical protein [Bradyrhizobium japonicum]MCD9111531.1 hypothetical protein [Bradyrhizobium japonicum]MCD9255471.1 hypothetical protein [Bradyrhizobium japonicum SEMIA 5079]MCD9895642.1 hypothetical protein [Bradyrhizobium japonicum]MCD9906936.1 hypothetical protein [Bradyrhizobium japonicum]MCS3979250.1 hypothetical protein [Bradyrhizobium japonicum]